jgi:hypothetical protein
MSDLVDPSPVGFKVPQEMVWACRTAGDALDLAIRASGKSRKQVYLPLKIDPGTFAKIIDNQASFPDAQIPELCRELGNRIFMEWQAYQVGCILVVVKSEAERELERMRAKFEASEDKVRMLTDMLKESGKEAAHP